MERIQENRRKIGQRQMSDKKKFKYIGTVLHNYYICMSEILFLNIERFIYELFKIHCGRSIIILLKYSKKLLKIKSSDLAIFINIFRQTSGLFSIKRFCLNTYTVFSKKKRKRKFNIYLYLC